MLILKIAIIFMLLLGLFVMSAVWWAYGKLFGIEDLTYKNAFGVVLTITLTAVFTRLMSRVMTFMEINNIGVMLILLLLCLFIIVLVMKKKLNTTVWKLVGISAISIIVAVGLAMPLGHLVQSVDVSSMDMMNSLKPGDRILIEKYVCGIKLPFVQRPIIPKCKPRRGDIVEFIDPIDKQDTIRRVIAVAGDTLEIRDKKIYINGEGIGEKTYELFESNTPIPSVLPKAAFETVWLDNLHKIGQSKDTAEILKATEVVRSVKDNFGPVTVPGENLFVMGDNRDKSVDSRIRGFVPTESVKGRVFNIYWSKDNNTSRVRLERIGRYL